MDLTSALSIAAADLAARLADSGPTTPEDAHTVVLLHNEASRAQRIIRALERASRYSLN